MAISQEIFIDAQLQNSASLSIRLSAAWRKALSMPRFTLFRRAASQVIAMAEPPGRLAFCPCPVDPAQQSCSGVTVVSANLWHDIPRFRNLRERLESFARLIENEQADVVLVQEVLRRPDLWVDEWLSERLGMGYVYSRANYNCAGIGFEEGIAVFSRFPLHTPQLARLGAGRSLFFRRLALGASVETPCGRLLAFSAHLGIPRAENAAQLAHLRSWVTALAGEQTAVIGGDFNTFESSLEIRRTQSAWLDTFRYLHPHADGVTHELRLFGSLLRRARLDYIFLHPGSSNWRVLETRHVNSPAGPHSDHLAVVTRLQPA